MKDFEEMAGIFDIRLQGLDKRLEMGISICQNMPTVGNE